MDSVSINWGSFFVAEHDLFGLHITVRDFRKLAHGFRVEDFSGDGKNKRT